MENKFEEYNKNLKNAKELQDKVADITEDIIKRKMEIDLLNESRESFQKKYDDAEKKN